MSTDPDDLGQGPGGDGSGGAGTPTPNSLEAVQADNERLKQENAKLREDKREERARALGAEHGLSPTQVDLLKLLPADQQETAAKALEAERGAPTGGAPPAGDGGQPPAPAAGDPAAPGAPPPDPSLQAFDGQPPGNPVGDPSLSWQDEMRERIDKAETLEEIAAIQLDYKQRSRAAGG
jgi:hypothetical protein